MRRIPGSILNYRNINAVRNISSSSVDSNEIANWKWWDTLGPMKALHHINTTRVMYVKKYVSEKLQKNSSISQNLFGLRFLDVGCGAGIFSESLATLGGQVTGIDASLSNIQAADLHARKYSRRGRFNYLGYNNNLSVENSRINKGTLCYLHNTIENLVENKHSSYDVVSVLEVIEHVNNASKFLITCCELVKPGGLIFISTINKTIESYLKTILGAEYMLHICEPGTHEWNKYIAPTSLSQLLTSHSFTVEDVSGISYNPLTWKSGITKDTSVNYILCARKNLQ